MTLLFALALLNKMKDEASARPRQRDGSGCGQHDGDDETGGNGISASGGAAPPIKPKLCRLNGCGVHSPSLRPTVERADSVSCGRSPGSRTMPSIAFPMPLRGVQ
jgi:hypothetical protein